MADFNIYPALDVQKNIESGVINDLQAQQMRNTNALFPLIQQQQQMQVQLQRQTQSNALIRDAADKSEDSDDFDKRMQQLQAQGYPEAGQYIGKYSPRLRERIRSGFAPGAMGGGGGAVGMPGNARQENNLAAGGIAGGGNGALAPSEIHDISKMRPEEVQSELAKQKDMVASADRVANSPNPAQTWEEEKQKLIAAGHKEVANVGPYNPEQFPAFYNHLKNRQAILEQSAQGIPVPRAPLEPRQIGGGEFTFDPHAQDPSKAYGEGPVVPNQEIVGYTKEGLPVYHDRRTGQETVGKTPVETGRYGQGRPGRTGSGATAMMKNAQYMVDIGMAKTPAEAVGMINSGFKDPLKVQALVEKIRNDVANDIAYIGLDPEEREAIVQKRVNDMKSAGTGGGGATPAASSGPAAPAGTPAIPAPLKAVPGLQWSPSRKQFRDPKTGKTYDATGKPAS